MTTDSDFNLRLVKGWQTFKDKIANLAETMEEATVELHFESSIDERTHFKFEPDEPIFVSEVEITPTNRVSFGVPFGDKRKYFLIAESELINVKVGSETTPFNVISQQLFKEAMAEVPECPSFTHLERKFLLADSTLREALNDSEVWLEKNTLSKERAVLYTKLDDFGMF
jgi:hypothetical protein